MIYVIACAAVLLAVAGVLYLFGINQACPVCGGVQAQRHGRNIHAQHCLFRH